MQFKQNYLGNQVLHDIPNETGRSEERVDVWKNQSRDPDSLVPAGLADGCGGSHGWHFQESFYRRNRPHFLASFGLFCPFLLGILMSRLEVQQTSCNYEATEAEDEKSLRSGGEERRQEKACPGRLVTRDIPYKPFMVYFSFPMSSVTCFQTLS